MAIGNKVTLQVSYIDDWLKVEVPVDAFAISAVRVTFKTEAPTSMFLDRLEMRAKSYNTNKLTLEKTKTKLDRDFALTSAEFGEVFETLHDTIKENVKEGDIALSIVAKQ